MSTVKGIMAGLGTGTGGNVSMLGDFFGFIRRKVPADRDARCGPGQGPAHLDQTTRADSHSGDAPMMSSLRSALAAIGEPAHLPLAIPSSFGRRMPASLRQAMDGMTDPAIGQWHKVGVALSSENTELSEEAQGAATDGARWYVSSNKLKGVVAFDDAGNRTGNV